MSKKNIKTMTEKMSKGHNTNRAKTKMTEPQAANGTNCLVLFSLCF